MKKIFFPLLAFIAALPTHIQANVYPEIFNLCINEDDFDNCVETRTKEKLERDKAESERIKLERDKAESKRIKLERDKAEQENVDPKVAEICMKAVDFKGCVESISGTKKNNPSSKSEYDNALVHLASLDTSSAMKSINLFIEDNPMSKEAYLLRSIIYSYDLTIEGKTTFIKKALRDLDKAIEIDDNYSYAYAIRADNHFYIGNTKQAKRDIEKAIDLAPNHPHTNHLRGHIYKTIGLGFLEKKNYELALFNGREAQDSFETALKNHKTDNQNLIMKRFFPFGLTYYIHTALGDTQLNLLFRSYREIEKKGEGGGDEAKKSLIDAINHYSNAIISAPTKKQTDNYTLDTKDKGGIVHTNISDIYLLRGNAYELSNSSSDQDKACEDWKKSKELGNKEAIRSVRKARC